MLALQAEISKERQLGFIGKRMKVLVEEIQPGEGLAWGRSYREAPEVDGLVGIHGGEMIEEGSFVEVLVTDADEYDLFAEIPGSQGP